MFQNGREREVEVRQLQDNLGPSDLLGGFLSPRPDRLHFTSNVLPFPQGLCPVTGP
jgi:hypothetical protein